MHAHPTSQLSPSRLHFSRQELNIIAATVPLILAPAWIFYAADMPGVFGTVTGMVVLLLVSVSAMTDLSQRKIFNWATYPAVIWGFGINLLASSQGSHANLGAIGIADCLAGAGTCLALMLVAYNLAHGGAGDVKLAIALGALLGPELGVLAVAYSYIVAAVCILTYVSWQRGPLALVEALFRKILSKLFPGYVINVDGQQQSLLEKPVPLAGFFAIGTILAMLEPVLI